MRDYQPPYKGNSLVSVSVCIYGTGTIKMARRSVLFPTSNLRVLGCTKETHSELNVSLLCEREPALSRVLTADGQQGGVVEL